MSGGESREAREERRERERGLRKSCGPDRLALLNMSLLQRSVSPLSIGPGPYPLWEVCLYVEVVLSSLKSGHSGST